MRLPFRVSRTRPAPPPPAGLPAARAERVLLSLAMHAQQIDDRLDRIERRLGAFDEIDPTVDHPTHEDLSAVRVHSARVAAEVSRMGAVIDRVTADVQGQIDRLVMQTPVTVLEGQREQRARALAETIIDLSDALDTNPVDLRHDANDWAITA